MKKVNEFFLRVFWKLQNFFEDWIFPAYHVRRLFHRKDIIKLEGIKPWDWCDEREQMLLACKAIVKSFFDQEPDKIVCYYKDEYGQDVGPKVSSKICPEIDGKYFFNVLKDVREILFNEVPELEKDFEALLSLSMLISPRMNFDKEEYRVLEDYSACPKTWEEAESLMSKECTEDEVIRIKKYVDFEEFIKKGDKPTYRDIFNITNDLQEKMSSRIKTALHWLVEIREGLWI